MKLAYLKNFRKGFATNSSSTHSLIYKNKDEVFKDLNIFELNFYDRCDNTIAATREAKIKYICANIYNNKFLLEVMSKYYPEMEQYFDLIEKQDKSNDDIFGMYFRGALTKCGAENLEFNIQFLRNIIDNNEIIIIGGSDEQDFVYDTCENHKTINQPGNIDSKCSIIKNGNYWIAINKYNGNKLRYNLNNEDCIPESPELIDLKITDYCEHGCSFCYMGSNRFGKHADINFLKTIISQLSSSEYSYYKKKIEFAIGGGNILNYPNIEELFKYMYNKEHIINTTINVKDVPKICNDGEFKYYIGNNNENNLLNIFNTYVSGLGISISNEKDLDIFKKHKIGDLLKCKIVLHIIPELLGVEKTKKILSKAYSLNYFDYLFLGYKTNNRGASQQWVKFNNEELIELFKDFRTIGIDTTFANRYKNWLINNYSTEHTITWNEGEYSMYIDGVTENAYKSSYQLDKPYNLTYGKWNEKNKTWFNVNDAFKHIREDNGFKTI